MTTALRVGLIGVGWGALVQAPAFQAVDGYELAALCSRRTESVTAAAARLDVPDTTTDWRALVARDDLDLISIATPVDSHLEIALAALAAGKHVLCEKPLAPDAARASELVGAAADSGLVTATCFEGRWLPERLAVRSLVDEGIVGTPYSVRVSQSAAYWHPTRPLQSLWMYDVAAGGGYLAGLVVHDIDFVCSLFGEPVAVCADVRTSVRTRDLPDGGVLDVTADDTSALLLRLDSGALAVLSASVVGAHVPTGMRLEAFGSDGTVRLDKTVGSEELLEAGRAAEDGLRRHTVTERVVAGLDNQQLRRAGGMINCMGLMLEEWLPAFSGGSTRAPTFSDGLRAQRVIDAARASSDGQGWVTL
jgi:predicted dehydrogenase